MSSVILFSHDVVGERMAGPAIRYWELATELALRHDVTLAVPNRQPPQHPAARVVTYRPGAYHNLLGGQDVCITQLISPRFAYAAMQAGTRVILDFYDPILFEDLEHFRDRSAPAQRARNRRTLARTRMSLRAADAVICASERQRDLWLGSLLALDRIVPDVYGGDPSLRGLIDVVPFGMPRAEPIRTGPGFRARLGIGDDDTVLLWGGGIWEWLDPLTAISALGRISRIRPDVHLVFLGTRHPNSRVGESPALGQAKALAGRLGLAGRSVHFNAGWVPYLERANHLLDADIGVSLHHDHLETRFSFRTRVLDYLWARLPVLSTGGDAMADLVAEHGLGAVVPPGDIDAVVDAVMRLSRHTDGHADARRAIEKLRGGYTWTGAATPLLDLIELVTSRPRRGQLSLPEAIGSLGSAARQVVAERRYADAARSLRRRMGPTTKR